MATPDAEGLPAGSWTVPTPFGPSLRVGAGLRGIAEASFDPDPGEPNPPPEPLRGSLESYLADPARGLPEVDVDLSAGTTFQRRVWEVLRAIPAGETRTYGEVAEAAGSPGAARAVGQAVAANPVVLLVPCHRVVPAAGGVGDYSARGGTALKRRILEAEGALPA